MRTTAVAWAKAAWAGLALAVLPAPAQEPAALRSILERYARAASYCESGSLSESEGQPPHPFSFCAGPGGRFKLVSRSGGHEHATWAHGEQVRTYSTANGQLKDYPRDPQYTYGFRFGQGRPAAAYSHLLWMAEIRRLDDLARLERFEPQAALSTAGTTVLERKGRGGAARLYVREADQVLVRYELERGGRIQQYVQLDSVQLGRRVSGSDLSYRPPWLAHVALQNSPAGFLVVLVLGSMARGALGWLPAFARADDDGRVLRLRNRLWRLQGLAFLVTAAVLGGLAILASMGKDSGHPPAIVVVLVLAAICALAFTALACATLASHPVHWLLRRRSR